MLELLSGFKNATLIYDQATKPTKVLDIQVVKMNHEAPTRFEVAVDALQA